MDLPSHSSDESSLEPASTGPTTPEWSPYLLPQTMTNTQLLDDRAGDMTGAMGEAALQDSLINNVCVIGAGYVGGPTAAVLALHNPRTRFTVLDRDRTRIASWQGPHLPIHEPGLNRVVRLVRDGGRANTSITQDDVSRSANLFFSTDSATSISQADIILLAVNTPTKYSGRGAGAASDLSALEGATRDIATYAKNGAIICEKSTVPVGTVNLITDILSSLRPGERFPVLSNPEFLAEGSAIKNLLYPDRVLIGAQDTVQGRIAAARLAELYLSWVPENKVIHSNVYSAELSKLVANAMLAQRISSINGISALCEKVNADVREVSRNIGTDLRIGNKFLSAGPGFGGSCFRKDVSSLVYILESLHLPEVADYWRCVLTMNEFQRVRFAEKIVSKLNNTLSGKKICLLGFAYKKDTGDTRESLAVDVIKALLHERPMEIAIFDPCCPKAGIEAEIKSFENVDRVRIYSDPYEACRNAHSIAIITEWDFFRADRPAPLLRTPTMKASFPMHKKGIALPELPLEKYIPTAMAKCPPTCKLCSSIGGSDRYIATNERLDWAVVAKNMRHPRFVLDGRGILDERVMRTFGVDLEGLGWGPKRETTSF